MLADHSLRLHSPLKSVFNKIGDSYKTFINSYKTDAMATHQRGTGQSLEETSAHGEQDSHILTEQHHEDMDNFENLEHENHTTLKTLPENLIIYGIELKLPKFHPQKL